MLEVTVLFVEQPRATRTRYIVRLEFKTFRAAQVVHVAARCVDRKMKRQIRGCSREIVLLSLVQSVNFMSHFFFLSMT